jgi:hypothetical protein
MNEVRFIDVSFVICNGPRARSRASVAIWCATADLISAVMPREDIARMIINDGQRMAPRSIGERQVAFAAGHRSAASNFRINPTSRLPLNTYAVGTSGSLTLMPMDRDTARALVDGGYMPLSEYIKLFGETTIGPDLVPSLQDGMRKSASARRADEVVDFPKPV